MVTIEHASVHAADPRRAAENLAALTGGRAVEFTPLRGAWACLFDHDWDGHFIEIYPRTASIVWKDGAPGFATLDSPAVGAGTHFNLRVDRTRAELEAICAERGLQCSWRGWASFLDVQIDEGFVVECVPTR